MPQPLAAAAGSVLPPGLYAQSLTTHNYNYVWYVLGMTTHNSTAALPDTPETTTHNSTTEADAPTPVVLSVEHQQMLAMYRADLDAQPDLSTHTRSAYVAAVRRIMTWLDDPDIDADYAADPLTDDTARAWAITDWRQDALHGRVRDRYGRYTALSEATIKATLAGLSDWYLRQGMCALDSREIKRPVVRRSTAPPAVRGRERVRLDRALTTLPVRDQALMGVMRYAGLRKAEAVGLNVSDVTLSARKGTLRVVGKGSKVRHVPVSARLRELLQEWMAQRPSDAADNSLFVSARGGRLSPRAVTDVVARLAREADLPDLTPHTLRHTFATELVREVGVDLVTVADLLGHASIEITRGYATASDDDLAAAVNAIDTTHLR